MRDVVVEVEASRRLNAGLWTSSLSSTSSLPAAGGSCPPAPPASSRTWPSALRSRPPRPAPPWPRALGFIKVIRRVYLLSGIEV